MDFKLFVFLAILKLVSSAADADPDPDTIIEFKLVVKGGGCCPGDCCPEPVDDKYCKFNDELYPIGTMAQGTCEKLQCIEVTDKTGPVWNYIGKIDTECGLCTVQGDPHIFPYEKHYYYENYDYQGNGTFVITRHSLATSIFGVNSEFVACGDPQTVNNDVSCIMSAIYYEPGITISMILPDVVNICTSPNDPLCRIQVLVNGIVTKIGKGVSSFNAEDGTVLIFWHNHLKQNPHSLRCINVVGSKGLSVSLCTVGTASGQSTLLDYAWLYVWAMPSLKANPSQLYGLCDTYTGEQQDCYTYQNGACNNDICDFGNSWVVEGEPHCYQTPTDSPCETNTTLKNEIKSKCEDTIPGATSYRLGACVFDLCRVPDIEKYLNGYKYHGLVDQHLGIGA